MPMDPADHLLIEAVRRGEESAWEQLISRFEGRLLSYVQKRIRQHSQAEDIVQDTFLGFLLSLPNYDEETPLESFLFSIASYKLTDQLRRSGKQPQLPLSVPDDSGNLQEPAGKARHASSLARSGERRHTEELVIAASLRELIQQWILEGNWERLACMELLWVLGWSNKKVAARLSISEQAVANHKHFVQTKLKQTIEKRTQNVDVSELGLDET